MAFGIFRKQLTQFGYHIISYEILQSIKQWLVKTSSFLKIFGCFPFETKFYSVKSVLFWQLVYKCGIRTKIVHLSTNYRTAIRKSREGWTDFQSDTFWIWIPYLVFAWIKNAMQMHTNKIATSEKILTCCKSLGL